MTRKNVSTELKIVGEWSPPKMIPVAKIIIDDGDSRADYQRGERHAFSLWDWAKYDPIRVGDRGDGMFHAIEGGHRTRQARRFGIAELPGFLMPSSGYAEEAMAFVELDSTRKRLKARERFKAAVAAGSPREVALFEMLARYGLRVADGEAWPCMKSVSCLLRTSIDSVEFAVSVICDVWKGDWYALREPILVGLADLPDRFKRKNRKLDRDRLIAKLMPISPIAIIRETSVRLVGDNSTRYGDVFERIYDKNSRKQKSPNENGSDSN